MKIAFIGDSFCADTGLGTWPSLIKNELKKAGNTQFNRLTEIEK